MEKSFQFIDGAQVDRRTRKLIRSHVMKGKNAGRKIHRPSKLAAKRRTDNRQAFQQIDYISNSKPDSECIYSYNSIVARKFQNSLLSLSFPFEFELTPHSTKVISQFFIYVTEKMYPSHLGLSPDECNPQWLRLLFMDEATSHCTIASMEACNEFFFGKSDSSPEAMYHLSKTFDLVNKRLESDEALSDSTLGVILMLVIQEQIRKEHLQAEVHYEGLKKMVELRGGLGQLESNLPLLLKICKTDITYALQTGRPMLFYRDRMSEVRRTFESKGLGLDQISSVPAINCEGIDPVLHEILVDIRCLTSILNSVSPGLILNINTFLDIIISVCSRLILYHPLQDYKPISAIDAVYHISLVIFMMTSFLQLDRRQILRYDLVNQRLKEVLENDVEGVGDDLVLWLMVVGGIWLSGGSDGAWLVPRIRELAGKMGIGAWGEVRKAVGHFPWIGVLHDEVGQALWSQMSDLAC